MRVRSYKPLRLEGAHRVYELLEGDSIRETADALLREAGATRGEMEAHGRIDVVRVRGAATPLVGELDVMVLRGVVSPTQSVLRFVGVDAGGAVHAGVLEDARAVELELQMRMFVDTIAEKASAPVVTSWADVAAASALAVEEDVPAEQPSPRLGDRIVHPTFGECVVEKMDEGDDFVFVRAKNQRLLRLSLDILQLELLDETGGLRRFAARVAKPGKGRP